MTLYRATDNEMYYAEMEAARNESEDAYFKARPQFDVPAARRDFRAGFERAFGKLWTRSSSNLGGEK